MTEYTFKHVADGDKYLIVTDNEKKAWDKLRLHLDPMEPLWKDDWEIVVTIISKRSEKPCIDQSNHPLGCSHRNLNLKEMRYLCYYSMEHPDKCSHRWYSLYRKGEEVATMTMFNSIVSVETYLEEHNLDASDYEVKEVIKS